MWFKTEIDYLLSGIKKMIPELANAIATKIAAQTLTVKNVGSGDDPPDEPPDLPFPVRLFISREPGSEPVKYYTVHPDYKGANSLVLYWVPGEPDIPTGTILELSVEAFLGDGGSGPFRKVWRGLNDDVHARGWYVKKDEFRDYP